MGFLKFIKELIKNREIDEEEFLQEDMDDEKFEESNEDSMKNIEIKEPIETIENVDPINKIEANNLSEEEIDKLILKEIYEIISVYEDFERVKIAAKEAAVNIGIKYIDYLPNYLNLKISRIPIFREKYSDPEEWKLVVENTVLMIIYNFKEHGVSLLQKIGQKNNNLYIKVTNLLCKLASENIKTDEIINSIMENIMAFNDETKISILGCMSQIKGNNQVIGLIQHFYKTYIKKGDAEKSLKLLKYLINAAERFTQGHLQFLKDLSLGSKTINLEKITVLEENEPKLITLNNINEELRVDAAITYYMLDDSDREINNTLYYLRDYSLDRNLRERINKILK
ncbi:hypothetical protein [Caproiciproducens sp. MSJ-32]|uniref:hypothetical protein n=1 Tax=Caproiciproducens sp. MSJ-32 TaxID=2841527 RepID=UPI001C1192F5|nr:hypothetical protein [Caproiciproducens sp. MSJ-32]MBU5456184.1 hypothetical protein [Caproiciproducens sp. MSJ-32]